MVATDRTLAELDMKAQTNEPLDPVEIEQYRSYYRLASRHADMAFLQYQQRLITEDQLYGVLAPLRHHLGGITGKILWAEEQDRNFAPGFVEYINPMMIY